MSLNAVLDQFKDTPLAIAIRKKINSLLPLSEGSTTFNTFFSMTVHALNFIQVVSLHLVKLSIQPHYSSNSGNDYISYLLVVITIQNLFNKKSLSYSCILIAISSQILIIVILVSHFFSSQSQPFHLHDISNPSIPI